MARACAESYLKSRYEAGFPLIRDEAERESRLALHAARYGAAEAKQGAD